MTKSIEKWLTFLVFIPATLLLTPERLTNVLLIAIVLELIDIKHNGVK